MRLFLNQIFTSLPSPEYSLILIFIFVAVSLLAGGVTFIFLRRDILAERLSRLVSAKAPEKKEESAKNLRLFEEAPKGFVVKVANSFNHVALPEKRATKGPRLKLLKAGFRSKRAYMNYLACKVLGGVILPVIYMTTFLFFKFTSQNMLFLALLALIGFFLPDLFLSHKTQKRQEELSRGVPDALDLMVVCVEAGLGLNMTFKRVGEEIRPISKSLSDEFLLTNLEIRSGQPREESFKNMALRCGIPEVRNLMTILNQSSRFGTSLAKALRVHSDAMRVRRRQIAEEKAAKSAVKLLFPLVAFIFPSLFIVILGPAVIRIMHALLPAIGKH